eukprot:scaffold163927_cov23-Tisochrysis_lutea.AAC.1
MPASLKEALHWATGEAFHPPNQAEGIRAEKQGCTQSCTPPCINLRSLCAKGGSNSSRDVASTRLHTHTHTRPPHLPLNQ